MPMGHSGASHKTAGTNLRLKLPRLPGKRLGLHHLGRNAMPVLPEKMVKVAKK
jgi:hypothetical protein